MKTISIFAYDDGVVEDFLKILNPMVSNQFDFETYLYTAYSTSTTIGGVGVSEATIRSIRSLKAKYKHVANICVYGLVATGEESAPEPDKYAEFAGWLTRHVEDLDLDGIALDYEFSNNWKEKKHHYTDFSIKMTKAMPDKQVSIDIGSYRYPGVSLDAVGSTSAKVVNMGMYASKISDFNTELWEMFRSPIKHANQVPAISFTHANVSMGKRLDRLQSFGYERLAIFNPLTHVNDYALDVAKFVDGTANNQWWWPTIIGGGAGLTVCGVAALLFYIFKCSAVVQIYIGGGLAIVSLGSICLICYNMRSMLQYTALSFAVIVFMCSTVWIGLVWWFVFCTGTMTDGIECGGLDAGSQKTIGDVELGEAADSFSDVIGGLIGN